MHRDIFGVRFSVSFLALLLVVFLSACSSATVTPAPAPESSVSPVKNTSTSVVPKAVTGTFHERVSYNTPESLENVDFVFTVDSGVVKNLTLSSVPAESNSKKYQARFMDAIVSQVIGKKISDIGTFDRVGGASLTTPAFNEAVAALKTQS